MEIEVTLDCADAHRLAAFWAAALDYEQVPPTPHYHSLRPRAGAAGIVLVLQPVDEPKVGKNRMHLDLYPDDVLTEVARLESLGARRVEDGEVHEDREWWVVMTDPEGNEFCVCGGRDEEPGPDPA